ncbi:hypothetical protein EOD42_14025 [Rhodovarius crocodyli]|uniref:Uncharacterized protein n=1 Tax=Rhodovarius crocodyli TaxID=1979269 RepID=A0A437MF15_9PROT|nr:hypothetical protein [Rhodovarius crocodyli]RVT96227.1 hypothetical protein EOD42_14025 [Rhodovarius crocodyli]
MAACAHHWVQSWKHFDHAHHHEECSRCATRRVLRQADTKVMWDVTWLERRGEPEHPTAGDPIVIRPGGFA